jgi:predicted dehydrogenase
MAQTYQVPTAPDWKEALARGGFDAAVICAPAHLHIQIALGVLAAGAHVLIEKPLSNSLQGVDELIALRDRQKRQASVAYVMHMFPPLAQARAFLLSGDYGPVREATLVSGQAFHIQRPAYRDTYYRDRRMGGGAIQDALTHPANWMESVLGPAESVLCDCAHLELAGVEVEDTVHVAARYSNGALVSYALNQFQMPNEVHLQLNTARASVKIELHNQRWGVLRAGDADWTWHEAKVKDRDSHFVAQANAFLDQIDGLPSRLCSVEAAALTLRFNLAALASAESGARVYCKDLHA